MANHFFGIGINEYKYFDIQNLDGCVKDVVDVHDILLEKYDFEHKNMSMLLDGDATNQEIQNRFSNYINELNESDNLIVFFSGHGHYNEIQNRGFWIPHNASKNETTWLANETLLALLDRIKCRHIVLIIDSCFSNSLLITGKPKLTQDYYNRKSRWALASAFEESYDSGDKNQNSKFADSIIQFLEETESDFRFTELINEVKNNYTIDVNQTPQGQPLMLKDHNGGEFIFKVRSPIDGRNFKGYRDFITTLQSYKRSATFKEKETFEDRTNKIGFQLILESDKVINRLNNYLYLYSGISQVKTLNYLRENHPNIFKGRNLLVFIPKEVNQRNIDIRKNNIHKKFDPINTFYIDEFIRDHCSPLFNEEHDDANYLQISNFVIPSINDIADKSTVKDYVNTWFEKESEPILVLKGTGGIGKTTFAQYITDLIRKENPKKNVLFIDSVQIKDILLKREKTFENINIYNFYEALYELSKNTSEKFSEDIFRLNVDAGNILIIIDGLDEVISKIPNFEVDQFLNSIIETSDELASGKVIITCRTHFWNKTDVNESNISVVELNPFNKNQTEVFFNKSFTEPIDRKKALKLANEFKFPGAGKDEVFHPYVLDIIRSIVSSSNDSIELDLTDFTSEILNNNSKNDYIIYRVCDRERKRIGQISVDEQLRFFVHLAAKKRGILDSTNIKTEIETALDKPIDNVNIEAFKAHPFLISNLSKTTFRYDFFGDLFKSIYLSKYFSLSESESEPSKEFVDIVSESCWFGSGLNHDIVSRIKKWDEEEILAVSDIINKVNNNQEYDIIKRRKFTSNLFSIALGININFNSNNIEKNTELLKYLFEESDSNLKNLSIINLNPDNGVRFDFSGLKLYNCYFDNYNYFYKCNFDSDTRFINCHLLNMRHKSTRIALEKEIFIDCTYDKTLENAFKESNSNLTNKIENIKSFLNQFFHLFYSNGRLGRQWEDKTIKPRFNGADVLNIGYKKAIKILKKHNVVNSVEELKKTKLYINDKYKEDIIRYVKDGTTSNIISILIREFESE